MGQKKEMQEKPEETVKMKPEKAMGEAVETE